MSQRYSRGHWTTIWRLSSECGSRNSTPLLLQNSTLSNTLRCYPGPLIAAPDYDRDRQEPPHWAGRESQKAHALGIKETTFRSSRSSGSMSRRILTLCWITAFNNSTLVLIEMLSIEYGFGPPSRKNQRSLDVCRDIVGDSRYWKISISNKRVMFFKKISPHMGLFFLDSRTNPFFPLGHK